MKEKSGLTNVVLADKKNAKLVKTILKERRILDDRYRMCPSVNDSSCIAIPILESQNLALDEILGVGKQVCPFSSRVLGNKNELYSSFHSERQLNSVQQIVFDTLLEAHHHEKTVHEYVEYILSLSREQCPSKLQRIGDDQTLLIQPNAFQFFDSAETQEFFYQKLAQTHQSSRIVRKHPNGISPDSPIRESKTQIVWPPKLVNLQKQQSNPLEKNKNNTELKKRVGFITVTEQGIAQSFDITRVMFSRGNITEKIRFGAQLVKEGEVILDMYSGIGYYTLPALIHGKAKHVLCCEWNEFAIEALQYNLQQNNIGSQKYTIWHGDCRSSIRENLDIIHNVFHGVDRISLGLLPSSEGGWPVAISTLRKDRGGWLHVHGNVHMDEKKTWSHWICKQLYQIMTLMTNEKNNYSDWHVFCSHVERVKSFAPKINHYVADIYLGPKSKSSEADSPFGIFLNDDDNQTKVKFEPCPPLLPTPSCALVEDGKIYQKWMVEDGT